MGMMPGIKFCTAPLIKIELRHFEHLGEWSQNHFKSDRFREGWASFSTVPARRRRDRLQALRGHAGVVRTL